MLCFLKSVQNSSSGYLQLLTSCLFAPKHLTNDNSNRQQQAATAFLGHLSHLRGPGIYTLSRYPRMEPPAAGKDLAFVSIWGKSWSPPGSSLLSRSYPSHKIWVFKENKSLARNTTVVHFLSYFRIGEMEEKKVEGIGVPSLLYSPLSATESERHLGHLSTGKVD